jgi:hypothetical protein
MIKKNKFYTLILGLLIILVIFLQSNIAFKIIQILSIIGLTFYIEKRIKILKIIIMMLSFLFVNLLIPNGKIYFNFFGFYITKGSLMIGLEKAIKVISLIYISKLLLLNKLLFPGKLGLIISKILFNFKILTDYRSEYIQFLSKEKNYKIFLMGKNIKRREGLSKNFFLKILISFKTIFYYIDNLLFKLTFNDNLDNQKKISNSRLAFKFPQWKSLLLIVIINWIFFLISFLI